MVANANVSGTVAIRGFDGKYMKVTSSNGMEFSTQKLDGSSKLIVKSGDNSKIGLNGLNDKYVDMYYIDDVKCEGPEGGVSFGIVYLANGQVNFTVTGYQGQDGRTRYLSSQAGNESYNGLLTVKEFEDITCRFTIQNLVSDL